MRRFGLRMSLAGLGAAMALAAQAQGKGSLDGQSEAMDRLTAESGATAKVTIDRATGGARFVRAAPGGSLGVRSRARAATDAGRHAGSIQFLNEYRSLFGITSADAELGVARVDKDRHGGTHFTYKQVYQGLPVFGAQLKTHFDASDNLIVANGNFIPGIDVNTTPTRSAADARRVAIARVKADIDRPRVALSASKPVLMIYREGLAKGVEGANHLAWQVEVGNGVDVRNFVYVDAHSGKVIDKIAGIYDAKNRRAYDGLGATAPGPNYPNSPFWVEGQAFPTGNTEADNMIQASGDVYDLFKNAFGRDSFDGNGARMDSIFNRGNGCPNASWNGTFISFCPGLTTDDVTAHEWGHAYTEYTHGLIYAWQPGALNESYSDIWGETVDRLNGRGGDSPDTARTAGACTASTPNPPTVNITAPAAIAGPKLAGGAAFGPTTFSIAGTVVAVNDGAAPTIDGCEIPFANAAAIAGKIAYMDRGICGFAVKVKNAQLAGAIGAIIGNNVAGTAPSMGGADPTVTIPSLSLSLNDATAIKAQLGVTTVTASLARGGVGTDSSVRWLMGEDATGGALRDMYNPTCYGNPGKVTDAQYSCGPNTDAGDQGGVHTNSGVPNHAYALIVDGGSYNGQSITGIGLTKAAHIYYRAQSVYQGPASDFVSHADSLEQSCTDLTGVNLTGLTTGTPSGQAITSFDCSQVTKAIAAVEMRTPPSQCNFVPLLAKSPPPLCSSGSATALLSDTFDGGKKGGVRWLVTHAGISGDFTPRDWGVVTHLPSQRAGYAIFASDPSIGTCAPGGNEAGVQRLESPEITLPVGVASPRLTFDHWVATEGGYDGGNLKISVNGGAWQVVRAADFVYNPYNATLATAAQGNDNPLAGQPAFTGSDGGSVGGSWGRSIVDLAPYAAANDKVKLRFEFGNDGCGGNIGWYVDDVAVYQCKP